MALVIFKNKSKTRQQLFLTLGAAAFLIYDFVGSDNITKYAFTHLLRYSYILPPLGNFRASTLCEQMHTS